MNSSLPLSVAIALCANPAVGSASHPFSVHDMLAMQRISEPRVSPDGERVVFTVRTTDMEENKGKTSLWLVRTDGSGLRRLTTAEWEHLGTPWTNPEGYQKQNPVNYVGRWKTPMLVIHGAKDYRVADSQGIGTFNALQRKGIPSKLLYFPDENHWVLSPHNSILWHETAVVGFSRRKSTCSRPTSVGCRSPTV
jgi:dipeptidyl aminopeptidase/acylaminoacyl peptidase